MVSFSEELGKYLQHSKYSRYIEEYHRRENWYEICKRVIKMHSDKVSQLLSESDFNEIYNAIKYVEEKKILPSMRSMQFGGKAIESHNERIYNCAVRHIDSIRSITEVFFLLLCGCGVGCGLSNRYISRFPDLVDSKDKSGVVHLYQIEDTIEGWANSVEVLLSCYLKNTPYTGRKIVFDYSKIRLRGTPLKTSGGKAPGYEGLKASHKKIKTLLDFIIEEKHQSRLKTINLYDILMYCSDAVLSGGIRRAALSIIFMLDDLDMISAKTDFEVLRATRFEKNEKTGLYEGFVTINDIVYSGKKRIDVKLSEMEYKYAIESKKISWIHVHPQRARSNNSVLLLRNECKLEDFKQLISTIRQYGEPGFVFADDLDCLYNPCFEIGFKPVTKDGICGVQFCNLTTLNGAKVKTEQDFYDFCKYQAIIGTLQATYTQFRFLSPTAKQLTEEESLIACSITGIFSNPKILLNPEILRKGAEVCKQTNLEWSKKLKIRPAARTTAIKPEGTGTLILAENGDIPSPGIHAHHSKKYFRRVQCNKEDPVYQYFKQINPHMCSESIWSNTKTDDVITFPINITNPDVVTKDQLTALDHLKYIRVLQKNWVLVGSTEWNAKNISNNVSCTVDVGDDEWDDVMNYLYENRQYFSAVSLLSKIGDKIFKQAPLERVVDDEDEKLFDYLASNYTPVEYSKLIEYEDNTEPLSESACSGGKCDLVR